MFKKILSLITLFSLIQGIASAQSTSLSPGVAQQPLPVFSRCYSSFGISLASATTTLISDGTTAALSLLGAHICSFYVQIVSGTSPTFKFVYGTKVSTNCDTGAVNITGAFAAAGVFSATGEAAQINVPAGKQICIVTGGSATPTFAGYVSYGYW